VEFRVGPERPANADWAVEADSDRAFDLIYRLLGQAA
jgi:hypothetical protein